MNSVHFAKLTFHEMLNNEDLHAHFIKNKSGLRETDFFFNGTFKSTFMEISYFCQFFAKPLVLTRNNPFLIVLIESTMCICGIKSTLSLEMLHSETVG